MNIDELYSKLKQRGITNDEKEVKKLLKRAVDTKKICYLKDDENNTIGFFTWEKVVYMNSMVIFDENKSVNMKSVHTYIKNKEEDCDTIYWKNRKSGKIKTFRLRRV